MGLVGLHEMTDSTDFGLRIEMGDYDGQKYHAVYDSFKVGFVSCLLLSCTVWDLLHIIGIIATFNPSPPQVGPGPGYTLTVDGFRADLSTLGDSMTVHNGAKFSTK